MSLIYNKTNWKDDKTTPVNAKNLNNIEDGIEYVYRKWDKIIQDSTTGDHAAELIDARYSPNDTEEHPTLGHRLNHMDNKFQDISSQLAHKISKNELFINVKDFGAIGNANYLYNGKYYQDEEYTILANDDTVAIQNALDYCSANRKTLYIDGSNYLVSSSDGNTCLKINSYTSIMGNSATFFNNSVCNSVIEIKGNQITIDNLKVKSDGSAGGNAKYIIYSNSDDSWTTRLTLSNCEFSFAKDTACYLAKNFFTNIKQCSFKSSKIGLYITGTTTNVYGCYAMNCTMYGYYVNGLQYSNFSANACDSSYIAYYIVNPGFLVFDGGCELCYIGMIVEGTSKYTLKNISISSFACHTCVDSLFYYPNLNGYADNFVRFINIDEAIIESMYIGVNPKDGSDKTWSYNKVIYCENSNITYNGTYLKPYKFDCVNSSLKCKDGRDKYSIINPFEVVKTSNFSQNETIDLFKIMGSPYSHAQTKTFMGYIHVNFVAGYIFDKTIEQRGDLVVYKKYKFKYLNYGKFNFELIESEINCRNRRPDYSVRHDEPSILSMLPSLELTFTNNTSAENSNQHTGTLSAELKFVENNTVSLYNNAITIAVEGIENGINDYKDEGHTKILWCGNKKDITMPFNS